MNRLRIVKRSILRQPQVAQLPGGPSPRFLDIAVDVQVPGKSVRFGGGRQTVYQSSAVDVSFEMEGNRVDVG